MAINPSGIAPHISYKRQLPVNPSFDSIARNYDRYRIPRPPEFDPEGTSPGLICWGTVGAMPSPEPLGGVGFNVKESYQETSRVSETVRVENPDDPSQYVMEDRPKSVTFDKTTNNTSSGPNTYAKKPEGLTDYGDPAVGHMEGFKDDQGNVTITGITYYYSETRVQDGHGPPGRRGRRR